MQGLGEIKKNSLQKYAHRGDYYINMLTQQKSTNHNRLYSQSFHLYQIHKRTLKPLVFLLIILMHVTQTNTCYTKQAGSSKCEICESPGNLSCTYRSPSNQVIQGNQSICINYCCNTKLFPSSSNYSFCIKTHTTETEQIHLSSLIIILVFVFFIIVCIYLSLRACLKKCKQKQKEEMQGSASAVDLAAFNMDDLGPLYQDKTINCSICLDNNCNIQTKCNHSYHSQCLHAWISKQSKCPLCLTTQINPILIYCTLCFKQSKLAILSTTNAIQQKQIWQKYQEYKCEYCLQGKEDDILISIQRSQNDHEDQIKNIVQNIQSQAHILQ